MDLANLSLTSIKLCSPVVVFIVYVIVSGISLFMTRNTLKRFKNQRMENLYNLYSWSEVKLVIVLGVIIYGLCQYEQMNLAWIYLIFPIIYIMLKNAFVFAYVAIAHQNAPKDIDPSDVFKGAMENVSGPASGVKILPEEPLVKKEVNTSIFGMRGAPTDHRSTPPTPPTMPMVSTPIAQLEGLSGPNNQPGGPPNNQPGGPLNLGTFFAGPLG